MKKVVKAIDKSIDICVRIFLLIVLLIGIYFIADSIYVYNHARADRVLLYKPNGNTEEALAQISEDAIAWITIDDTTIDYPIMQGKDNLEYLNKDVFGEYSLSGSIFLDSRNKPDFSDAYSLVYGHHLSNGIMFGALDDFKNKSFFDSHRTGMVETKSGKYKYCIFAFVEADASENIIFNVSSLGQVEYIKANALNYREPEDGNLLVLSTCDSPSSTRRFIVCGTLARAEE